MAEADEVQQDEAQHDEVQQDEDQHGTPKEAGRGEGVRSVTADTRFRDRTQGGFKEFLTRPVAITGAGIVLAGVVIIHDRRLVPWAEFLQHKLIAVVPPQAASTFLSTVTPGLLTVISIIFFVALMAVQHQSAKYSPVVIDQFMRRRINQVFFRLFVALTVYSILVLGLVPSGQAVVAGTVGLVVTGVTLVLLLVFIYSTLDQMRPSSAVWVLQKMALRARLLQDALLSRCRTESRLRDAPATNALVERIGYVVDIDGEALESALTRAQAAMDEVEVELWVSMGNHVVPGAPVAQVRGGTAEQREWLAGEVLGALTLGRLRDVDRDAVHAVNQLGSMAWSATAFSGDLEGARVAVEALHGVLTLFQQGYVRNPRDTDAEGDLPLVYRESVIDKVIDSLVNVVAASGLSGQHQSAADTLVVLSRALPNLPDVDQKLLIDRLERVLPTVTRHVFTVELEHGFDMLRHAMQESGETRSALRLQQIRDDLEEQHRIASPD